MACHDLPTLPLCEVEGVWEGSRLVCTPQAVGSHGRWDVQESDVSEASLTWVEHLRSPSQIPWSLSGNWRGVCCRALSTCAGKGCPGASGARAEDGPP